MAPLLMMRGIVKQFPGVRALDGVDLDVARGRGALPARPERRGQVDADQGAGRGAPAGRRGDHLRRPARVVQLPAGRRPGRASPRSTRSSTWFPGLSVAENVVLGHEPAHLGFTRPRDAEDRARGLLRRLGHPEIPAGRELGRLSAAGQQVVSMARALARDARLIVMDEPSAVLDPEEVQNLFRVIRELTADGVAIVYISHRLEEIRQIGDRVTVLKDGRTVARNLPAPRHPDGRGDPADDRAVHRVRVPAARHVAQPRGGARGRRADAARASSPTSPSRCVPARWWGWPGWSGPVARRSWRPSTAPAERPRARSGCTGGRCGPVPCRPPCGRGWGCAPRSARARACCWPSRCPATCRCPHCAASRGRASWAGTPS